MVGFMSGLKKGYPTLAIKVCHKIPHHLWVYRSYKGYTSFPKPNFPFFLKVSTFEAQCPVMPGGSDRGATQGGLKRFANIHRSIATPLGGVVVLHSSAVGDAF